VARAGGEGSGGQDHVRQAGSLRQKEVLDDHEGLALEGRRRQGPVGEGLHQVGPHQVEEAQPARNRVLQHGLGGEPRSRRLGRQPRLPAGLGIGRQPVAGQEVGPQARGFRPRLFA